ncbi:hypothetical protein [Helicobacter labetoulli]|uniref:hypothetical protein n=1 Tax=Helicobacter labetoulli TaxID=2315333 RepID=UPI000EF69472|nr:hypothetical protein [Helicobacter labetoulli]
MAKAKTTATEEVATTENTEATEATTAEAQTAKTNAKAGRRQAAATQRKAFFERRAREHKATTRDLLSYLGTTPRNFIDANRQQRFALLSHLILQNINNIDYVSIVVGDDFTRRSSQVLRNIYSSSKEANFAILAGGEKGTEAIEASKKIEDLKAEAIKTLNQLNSQISQIASKFA